MQDASLTVDPVILTTKSALIKAVTEGTVKAVAYLEKQRSGERAAAPGFGYVENEEAMRLLNLSRPTLARYRKDGRLPFSRLGSKVFYRIADIEAMMERHRAGGSETAALKCAA